MEAYFDERIERMPREEIRALREQAFHSLLDYVWEHQPAYREKMILADIRRESISGLEDIAKLPLTDKKDLEKSYPFGMQAAPDTEIIRINATSGTSGRMVIIPCTAADVELFERGLCRALAMQGCTETSKVQNAFSYRMFIGGMGVQGAAERLGAACIPTSTGNTERQIRFLRELGADILAATPSYALHIIEEMAQRGALDSIPLKSIFVAGEPCSESLKSKLETLSGATVYNVYGNAEMTNVFASCKYGTGMHIPEDMIYAEIVDENGAPLPSGQVGELVITTLKKRGLPLVRYNTHDIAVLESGECPCRRTSRRIRILGRSDGMIIHKGCKFFPSDIDRVIAAIDALNGKYKLLKKDTGTNTSIAVLAEVREDSSYPSDALRARFADVCRKELGASLELISCPPGTLEAPCGEKQKILQQF